MVEQRFVERRGRPRDHHRGAEQELRARRAESIVQYRPAALASATFGKAVGVPADPALRSKIRTGEVLDPVPPCSPVTRELIDWLRSGSPTLPASFHPPAGPVRPHTVPVDPEHARPEWLAEQLHRFGFVDPPSH